jgi:hypothetical protein
MVPGPDQEVFNRYLMREGNDFLVDICPLNQGGLSGKATGHCLLTEIFKTRPDEPHAVHQLRNVGNRRGLL